MKKILICTDESLFAGSSYRYGADVAIDLKVKMDVLCVTDIRSKQVVLTGNYSGSIGIDASENLLNRLVELEHEKAKLNHQRAKLILQTAASRLKSEEVGQINLIHKTSFLVDCLDGFEPSIVDLGEVPILGVTSSLAIENAIQEAIDAGRDVIVVGAMGKVKRRLEKGGIAGLIPGNHWMGDRLNALKEGLTMVREKQSVSYNEIQSPLSPLSDS